MERHHTGTIHSSTTHGQRRDAGDEPPMVPLPGAWIERTWHSDRTTNVMEIDHAAANVARFHAELSVGQVALALRRGEVLCTPLAAFRLYRPATKWIRKH